MCMSRGPSGPDPNLIRQQQEASRRQEALLEQQLQVSRAAAAEMKASTEAAQARSAKAMAEAEERRKVAEENLQIKQAKTEAIQQKGYAKITDKTRGRAGLKIERQSATMGSLNPIESLVNLPV